MTVVLCLNFGDRIYLATDSLMTSERPDGTLKKEGYRLKLYPVPHYNAVVAFAGSIVSARKALKQVLNFANEHPNLDEEHIFNELPTLITEACKDLHQEDLYDVDIVYAGLIPDSQAYEKEKFPGIGIPPKSYAGVFSLKFRTRTLERLIGYAIHVPSATSAKFFSPDPKMLMDGFVVGSGARRVKAEEFTGYKYLPPNIVVKNLDKILYTYFHDIPIDLSGVGGAYQIALITEEEREILVSLPGLDLRGVTIDVKHGTFVVNDKKTGQEDFIQTIWDERFPYEIRELGHRL